MFRIFLCSSNYICMKQTKNRGLDCSGTVLLIKVMLWNPFTFLPSRRMRTATPNYCDPTRANVPAMVSLIWPLWYSSIPHLSWFEPGPRNASFLTWDLFSGKSLGLINATDAGYFYRILQYTENPVRGIRYTMSMCVYNFKLGYLSDTYTDRKIFIDHTMNIYLILLCYKDICAISCRYTSCKYLSANYGRGTHILFSLFGLLASNKP